MFTWPRCILFCRHNFSTARRVWLIAAGLPSPEFRSYPCCDDMVLSKKWFHHDQTLVNAIITVNWLKLKMALCGCRQSFKMSPICEVCHELHVTPENHSSVSPHLNTRGYHETIFTTQYVTWICVLVYLLTDRYLPSIFGWIW